MADALPTRKPGGRLDGAGSSGDACRRTKLTSISTTAQGSRRHGGTTRSGAAGASSLEEIPNREGRRLTAVIVVAIALLLGAGLVISQLVRLRTWLGKPLLTRLPTPARSDRIAPRVITVQLRITPVRRSTLGGYFARYRDFRSALGKAANSSPGLVW